ncbi:MAG TPA: ABC transporter permease subunit [Acholeplasmataceae bacterium]|nr:ABC transporter permease subunit [Acholeplasmataceae bacterium]
MNNNNYKYILLSVLFIILLWAVSSLIIDNSLVLPGISEVILSLKEILSTSTTYLIILLTIVRLILVVLVSLVIAFILAILSYLSDKFESFIKPLFVILKTIPVIAIIVLLLITFGSKTSPYIMTSLVVLPIMYEGLLTSLKNINKELIDDVKTLSNTNWMVLKDFYFPIILNFIMMTLVQSFGIGLKVMVMGEFIAQPNRSIGYILQLERSNLNSSAILAWSVILIILVLLFEILVLKLSERFKKTKSSS